MIEMRERCRGHALAPVLGVLILAVGVSSFASIVPFQITMEGQAPYYDPFQAVVPAETPIKWENPTASPHTIRHDGCVAGSRCAFDSGAVPPDGSYVIPGLAPGRYPYHCAIHPIMRGELVIRDPVAAESRP